MDSVYQRGTLWELKTNAHLVPRGVYTLVGHFDEVLVFEVGRHIQFTLVERFYRAFLEKAKPSGTRPTSEGESCSCTRVSLGGLGPMRYGRSRGGMCMKTGP